MQTVRGGIKAAIETPPPVVQPRRQLLLAGNLENQAAGAEIV
jgi:hypothetical protein